MRTGLLVLYDEDCGFCRWSADRLRALDRRRARLRFAPIQTSGDVLTPVPVAEQLDAMHVVEADGRVWTGGAACARLVRELPGGGPLAWVGAHAPRTAERCYRWVAARRDRFGRALGTDACSVDPSRTP